MKAKTNWILLILAAILLIVAAPLAAWAPSEAEPVGDGNDGRLWDDDFQIGDIVRQLNQPSAEGGSELAAVPAGSYPGFYAARDWRNLDPAQYPGLVGGHQHFTWKQLEPTEGAYNWAPIDNFIAAQVFRGKRAAFGIVTFYGRPDPKTMPWTWAEAIQVPDFVFAAGAGKVVAGDGFQIPKYWHDVYQQKYRNFVQALAARYNGHPNLEFVQIGVGRFGETQPCDYQDNNAVKAALNLDGYQEYGTWWEDIVNQITAMYADYFTQTKLLLPTGPLFTQAYERKDFGEYAIRRGVGLFPAEARADSEMVDHRYNPNVNWYGRGKYDFIMDWAEKGYFLPDMPGHAVPVSFEMYGYMTPNPTEFFWGVLGCLSRRADYITLERDVLYTGDTQNPGPPIAENVAVMSWAAPFVGRNPADTPSVWVALRESGYRWNQPPASGDKMPQRGNYSFYILQDDSIAGGRTVATTWRTAEQLVRGGLEEWGGWQEFYNPKIEVGVTKLGGRIAPGVYGQAREGWITRRTNQSTGNPRMYFKVDDAYRDRFAGNQATIKVVYFDGGTDTWQLQYDAPGNAYKSAGTITKTNTETWKEAIFYLDDALMRNGQLGFSDFRIDCMNDGDEYVHFVEVSFGGSTNQTHNVSLTAGNDGWNFVSFRVQPSSTAIATVLSSIAGKYELVQAFVGGNWRTYSPITSGDLTDLTPLMGFWIKVTQDCTLSVTGQPLSSTSIPLSVGWNMIGWPSSNTVAVETALAGIAGNYDTVYTYIATDTADPWKLYAPGLPSWVNDLTQMAPGRAHWIHVTTSTNLVVN